MTDTPFAWSKATPEERRAHCEERNAIERAAQGLPPKVTDPTALANLAAQLRPHVPATPKARRSAA